MKPGGTTTSTAQKPQPCHCTTEPFHRRGLLIDLKLEQRCWRRDEPEHGLQSSQPDYGNMPKSSETSSTICASDSTIVADITAKLKPTRCQQSFLSLVSMNGYVESQLALRSIRSAVSTITRERLVNASKTVKSTTCTLRQHKWQFMLSVIGIFRKLY